MKNYLKDKNPLVSTKDAKKVNEYVSLLYDKRAFLNRLFSLKMLVTAVTLGLGTAMMTVSLYMLWETSNSPADIKEVLIAYLEFVWKPAAFWLGVHGITETVSMFSRSSVVSSGISAGTRNIPDPETFDDSEGPIDLSQGHE